MLTRGAQSHDASVSRPSNVINLDGTSSSSSSLSSCDSSDETDTDSSISSDNVSSVPYIQVKSKKKRLIKKKSKLRDNSDVQAKPRANRPTRPMTNKSPRELSAVSNQSKNNSNPKKLGKPKPIGLTRDERLQGEHSRRLPREDVNTTPRKRHRYSHHVDNTTSRKRYRYSLQVNNTTPRKHYSYPRQHHVVQQEWQDSHKYPRRPDPYVSGTTRAWNNVYNRSWSECDMEDNHHETICDFCFERNHVSKNCRHGAPIQCDRCGGWGHKAKHHVD